MKNNKTNIVIFLDIDGVFTSLRSGWYNWDIYAVNFFIWLCRDKLNAKIVISSSWRNQYNKEFFENIFPGILHDDWKTLYFRFSGSRGSEIDKWLDSHKDISDYLIIDDMNDMLEEQQSHFIHTDTDNGMLIKNYEDILNYFKIKDFPEYAKGNPAEIYIHKNMFDEAIKIKLV